MKAIYLLFAVIFFSITLVPVVYASGDAEQGKIIFKKCKMCHTLGKGNKYGGGPDLQGVLGRPAGTFEEYDYSNGIKTYGRKGNTWCEGNLDEFLKNPRKKPFKAKMYFRLKKEKDREDVIAYLGENSDNTEACAKKK
tara:strand:+ start:658 stop:1071 length:414 start_codon:yes stop_codon:yes gene_type:complete